MLVPTVMQKRRSGAVYEAHVPTTPLNRPKRPRQPSAAGRHSARRRTEGNRVPSPQLIEAESGSPRPRPIEAGSGSEPSLGSPVDLALSPLAEQPCDEPGITVIGRKVAKEFREGWFDGTVTQFYAQTKCYKVVYSDKDHEVMPFSALSNIIADDRFVGRTVRREFKEGWFLGTVTSFDPRSSVYEIIYTDGDEQNATLAGLSAIILSEGAPPGDLEDVDAAVPELITEPVDMHPEELERPPTPGLEVAAGLVVAAGLEVAAHDDVTREDAPHIPEQSGHSSGSSLLAFDVASLAADDGSLLDPVPDAAESDDESIGVSGSVHDLHAALLLEFANETSRLPMPIHETYLLAGVMIPYAVPPYMKPATVCAMLDWMETQNTADEFEDVHALTDENCRLDFAEFVLRCKIPHREYRHLRELLKKWLPDDAAFSPMSNRETHAKDNPGAYLQRLPMTRKTLEEYMDKRIAAHRQAHCITN